MSKMRQSWVLAMAVAGLGWTSGVRADVSDWIGTGDVYWATPGNWTGTNMPPLAGDSARFNQTTYTNQPDTGVGAAIGGLIFGDGTTATAALVLSGTGSLTLGSGGIALTANAGTATIGTTVLLATSQSWSNDSASLLTLSGAIQAADANAYTLTITGSGVGGTTLSGAIGDGAGTTSLSVSTRAGVTTLSGLNGFSGGVNLAAGTLHLNNNWSLGTGIFTIGAGTVLDNSSAGGVTIGGGNAQNWNGNFTFNGSNSLSLGTGQVTMASALTLTVQASTLTVGGLITGTGLNALDIAKAGAGTLALTNTAAPIAVRSGGQTMSCLSGTWTLAAALDTTAGVLAVDAAASSSVVLNGSISGANGIVKTGAGALTLPVANDFAGGVTLHAGTLGITNNNALGTGTFTINGGTLTNSFGIVVAGNLQSWNGSFTFDSAENLSLGAGAVTLGNNVTLTTVNAARNLTVGGAISGSYNLIKDGAGSLTLAGTVDTNGSITVTAGTLLLTNANTHSGGVFLGSAGTLVLNNNAALGIGTFVINGGTLTNDSSATMSNNNGQTWNAGFAFGLNGTAILDLGTGPVTLTVAPTVTFGANKTLIVGGVVSGTSLNALDITKAGAVGTLNLTNTNLITVRAGGQTVSCLGGSLTIASPIDPVADINADVASGSIITLSGIIGPSAGAIRKAGPGTLVLSGSSNFSGGVNLTEGRLTLNNGSALGTGTLTIGAGTTLFANGPTSAGLVNFRNNPQIWKGDFTFMAPSSTTNRLNLGTGAVTLEANVQVDVVAQRLVVGGAISGSGYSITKVGAGELYLSGAIATGTGSLMINGGTVSLGGASNFSGGVHLQSGILELTNTSALGTGTFTIDAGTTFWANGAALNANNNAQIWNGNFNYLSWPGSSTNKLNLGTGLITLTDNVQVGVYGQTLTLGGDVTYSSSTYTGFNIIKSEAGRLIMNGSINTGTGSVTLNNGILVLGGNNSFSGGVTINYSAAAHFFGFYNPGAIGTGTFTINGGMIYALYGTTGVVNANNNAQIWNADFAYNYVNAGANTTLDLGTGPVTMNNNIMVTANARTLTVGGGITGTDKNLTKAGVGTLALNGTMNLGAGSITVNTGTLALGNANTYAGGTTINGSGSHSTYFASTVIVGHAQALGSGPVAVTSTSDVLTRLQLKAGVATAAPFAVASSSMLTFSGGTMSQLDVTNNFVQIAQAASSLSDYAPHITTSTTQIGTQSGYAVAAAVVMGQEFIDLRGAGAFFVGSTTVNATDLLARFALAGDANLDNTITMDDYLAVDAGYRFGGTDWAHGDYNRDGAVTVADYVVIDQNAALANPTFGQEMQALHALQFGSAYTEALAAPVPEPASLALLGLGAAVLLRRRKHR